MIRRIKEQRMRGISLIDEIDREMRHRGGKVLAKKEPYLDGPALGGVGVATLSVGAAALSLSPESNEGPELSRRAFVGRGLKGLAVGAAAVAVLGGKPSEARAASSWGVALGTFAYCVGWLVGAWLEWNYSISTDDFTFDPDPEPSGDDFSDAFAQPHSNGNKRTYFSARKGLAMDKHLTTDLNGIELDQIHRERGLQGPMIAKTVRLEPEARWKGAIDKVKSSYGLLRGEAATEYVNALVEEDGVTKHLGVGVATRNGGKAYLIG